MTLLIVNDPLLQPSEYDGDLSHPPEYALSHPPEYALSQLQSSQYDPPEYALIIPTNNQYHYKDISIILIGGFIGTIAMTPLGILIGAKIGLSLLLGGGLLGSYGGYKAQHV